MLRLAIVIPTFNRKENLNNLLCNIKLQIDIPTWQIAIYVVVDGLFDGTIEMLHKKYSDLNIVIGAETWWFTHSVNEGSKAAEKFNPDFFLIMNDDVTISENFFKNLFISYRTIPNNSILGVASFTQSEPRRLTFSGVEKIKRWNFGYKLYHKPYIIIDPTELKGIYKSVVLPSRCMLIPFKLAKHLNYFDEKFPQYGSDYDFTLRAKKYANAESYITWDTYVFEDDTLTGTGSPKKPVSFSVYIKKLFSVYAPNSLIKNMRLLWRHGNKLLFLFGVMSQIIGVVKSYYYHRKKWQVI